MSGAIGLNDCPIDHGYTHPPWCDLQNIDIDCYENACSFEPVRCWIKLIQHFPTQIVYHGPVPCPSCERLKLEITQLKALVTTKDKEIRELNDVIKADEQLENYYEKQRIIACTKLIEIRDLIIQQYNKKE